MSRLGRAGGRKGSWKGGEAANGPPGRRTGTGGLTTSSRRISPSGPWGRPSPCLAWGCSSWCWRSCSTTATWTKAPRRYARIPHGASRFPLTPGPAGRSPPAARKLTNSPDRRARVPRGPLLRARYARRQPLLVLSGRRLTDFQGSTRRGSPTTAGRGPGATATTRSPRRDQPPPASAGLRPRGRCAAVVPAGGGGGGGGGEGRSRRRGASNVRIVGWSNSNKNKNYHIALEAGAAEGRQGLTSAPGSRRPASGGWRRSRCT